jgi:hypothetical protein
MGESARSWVLGRLSALPGGANGGNGEKRPEFPSQGVGPLVQKSGALTLLLPLLKPGS